MIGFDLKLSDYNILIVEDSLEYQSLILQSLGTGYHHICASSIKEAHEILARETFDCLIVDISLPDGSGFDLLQSHQDLRCPIIILSSSSEMGNKALGFSLGIQDYVEKPFQPMDLAIRVKSRIHFYKANHNKKMNIELGNLIYDADFRRVTIREQGGVHKPDLSRKEMELLNLFIRNPERLYSREQILDMVWGSENYVLERSVDSAVAALRRKLKKWDYKISTVYGVGYSIERKDEVRPEPVYHTPLIELFKQGTARELSHLETLLKGEDWLQIVKSVHKLKGSFVNFTGKLTPLADQIESSEASESLRPAVEKFLSEARELREVIISKGLAA